MTCGATSLQPAVCRAGHLGTQANDPTRAVLRLSPAHHVAFPLTVYSGYGLFGHPWRQTPVLRHWRKC